MMQEFDKYVSSEQKKSAFPNFSFHIIVVNFSPFLFEKKDPLYFCTGFYNLVRMKFD